MEIEHTVSESKCHDNEEKKSATQTMNDMYWKQMDMILSEYKKQNPESFELAQKKGEEIMSFDYKNPEEFVKKRDMKEYGKKVYKDVTYNGLTKEELSEYDLESLEEYVKHENISFSFDNTEDDN